MNAPFVMSAQLPPPNAPPPPARVSDRDADEPGDTALDCWLRLGLGRLYDSALTEPLPPALLRLLEPADPSRKDRG